MATEQNAPLIHDDTFSVAMGVCADGAHVEPNVFKGFEILSCFATKTSEYDSHFHSLLLLIKNNVYQLLKVPLFGRWSIKRLILNKQFILGAAQQSCYMLMIIVWRK